MAALTRNGVVIDDTFAEAFSMAGSGVVVTAVNERWVMEAARSMTGFATSVIACGCEAGIDRLLSPAETPDGRPGAMILIFGMSSEELARQLATRLGQCILTSPSSACFAGVAGDTRIDLGNAIRYFADGWQISKTFGGKHYWRMPVMEGEFLCEATTGLTHDAVGGGNLLFLAADAARALRAAETAVDAIHAVAGAIMPFPGGVVRSGSKIGGKYKGMIASTNDAFCPTLKGVAQTQLTAEIGSVLEIVIDGLTPEIVAEAMRVGLKAVIDLGPELGALRVSAGNYGGQLGPHHYRLRDLAP